MSPWQRYETTRPIAVEGGVKAKSKRGAIGERWWSKRFIAVLESYGIGSRLTRGRTYARKGQVMEFALSIGTVAARVQGSRPRPYNVTIKVLPLTKAQWKTVETRLASAALYRASLLAGEMPPEIEEVFAECGTPLFPRLVSDLEMHCSCPDWEVPCKHLAAVCYVLAEAFDEDPFAMLAWRGRGKDDLLAALRRTSGGRTSGVPAAGAGAAPTAADGRVSATLPVLADVAGKPLSAASTVAAATDFWSTGLSAARLRALAEAPPSTGTPDLLLRMFEPPPITIRKKNLKDILAPAYEQLASPAEEGRGGSLSPRFRRSGGEDSPKDLD
jgi:uncharacterized Zn finger protein